MKHRLPIFFILMTVIIDAIGIGLMMPVMPDLLREVTEAELSSAALWGGALSTAFALMQFLFGPLLGNLSDAYGRRPVLLTSLLFMAFDYLIMAMAGSIWLLLVARILGGITAATHSTASAFIADISSDRDKAANFGLLGAAFGIGFVIGPLLGGVLGEIGSRAPFWAAGALSLLNLVLGYFVLPETVTDRIRRPFLWRRANPLGGLASLRGLPGMGRLLLMALLYGIAFNAYPAVWAFFGRERFGWDAGMIGISLAAFGLGAAITQGVLIRPILANLGERNTVMFGLVLEFAAFFILGFLSSGNWAMALIALAALGSITGPALSAIMSRRIGDDRQGELQGMMTSANALAIIISPLLMTQIFWFFTREGAPFWLPGAPFLLSAGLMVIVIGLFAGARRN